MSDGSGAHGAGREHIRVMRCVTSSSLDGAEPWLAVRGPALDSGRFALEYAWMGRRGCVRIKVHDQGPPVRGLRVQPPFGIDALRQPLRLARHIGQRRIQIVHTCDFYSHVFAIPTAWVAGAPVIVASIRDRGAYLTPRQRHVQRLVCRLADCVLVNADSTKEWLASDGYPESHIAVISDGVDPSRFVGRRQTSARRDLGIPEGQPIIVVMAHPHAKRAVEDVIDAAAIVSWSFPAALFLIVGTGRRTGGDQLGDESACRRAIRSRIQRLFLKDSVRLGGGRADVAGLLSETAISVLPSLSEGVSNMLLESMAAGVPVVATSAGGTPDAVAHGETGLLVPPGDPQGLADAIASLLREPDLAVRLGAAGRHAVSERFGMERMVRATERLYSDLLVQKAAHPGWRGRVGLARRALEPPAGTRTMIAESNHDRHRGTD